VDQQFHNQDEDRSQHWKQYKEIIKDQGITEMNNHGVNSCSGHNAYQPGVMLKEKSNPSSSYTNKTQTGGNNLNEKGQQVPYGYCEYRLE
jgi:hypothetical protein